MADKEIYDGGCLCGNIRFIASGPPLKPHTCSCKICQRHSGALTLMWVAFDREQVQWTGPGGAPSTWRSSDWSSRAFCVVCGSTLGAMDNKSMIELAIGSFDAPNRQGIADLFRPYIGKRPNWWSVCDSERIP